MISFMKKYNINKDFCSQKLVIMLIRAKKSAAIGVILNSALDRIRVSIKKVGVKLKTV